MMDIKLSKNLLTDTLIKRTSSILDKQNQKHWVKKKRKGSRTPSEVTSVENISKSFLEIGPV